MSLFETWRSQYALSESNAEFSQEQAAVVGATGNSGLDPSSSPEPAPSQDVSSLPPKRKRSGDNGPSHIHSHSTSKKQKRGESLASHLPEIFHDANPPPSEPTLATDVLASLQFQNSIAPFPSNLSLVAFLASFLSQIATKQKRSHSPSPFNLFVSEYDDFALGSIVTEVQSACPYLDLGVVTPQTVPINTSEPFLPRDMAFVSIAHLYQLLRRSQINLNQANVIIINGVQGLKDIHLQDEVPIVQIINEVYKSCDPSCRPRVLGLLSIEDEDALELDHALLNVESILKGKTMGISNAQRQNWLSFPSRPKEIVILYDSPSQLDHTPLYKRLHSLDPTESIFRRHFKAARHALSSVGACGSDLIWRRALKEINAMARPWYEEGDDDDVNEGLSPIDVPTKARDLLKHWGFTMPILDTSSIGFNVTPKFIKLLDILRSCQPYEKRFRAIVFVQRRAVALAIVDIIRSIHDHSFLRPSALTGLNTAEQTRDIFRSFESGTCNLLVSTKSGEDLEMPVAAIIIRYDFFESQVSQAYVLSRARGRESHVAYMVERGNDTHRRILSQLMEPNGTIRQWLDKMRYQSQRAMPPPGLFETSDPYYSESEDEEMDEKPLVDAATGGVIRIQEATTVIYRLASRLRQQGVITSDGQPLFEFRREPSNPPSYVCTVALSGAFRRFCGSPSPTAALSRRSACFAACSELYQEGCLEYSLFPQPHKELDSAQDGQYALGSGDDPHIGMRCYTRRTPMFWSYTPSGSHNILYPYIISIEPSYPDDTPYVSMVLLTYRPLPDLESFRLFGDGVSKAHFCRALPLMVSAEQLDSLRKFTIRLCRGIANRALTCPSPEASRMFWVPVLRSWQVPKLASAQIHDPLNITDHLDWSTVLSISEQWAKPLVFGDADPVRADTEDSVIQDRSAEYTRRYILKTVRKDLTPLSKPVDSPREAGHGSLLAYIKARRSHFEGLSNNDQCIIEVQPIPPVANLLNPGKCPTSRPTIKDGPKYLIPELCFKFAIPYSIFRTGLLLPSIMQRIDEFLLVRELNARFFDNCIREDLLHKALCAPSSNSEYDYERLELLGDAFLKYLSSVYVFVTNPTQSEHAMHVSRQKIISNKALLQNSTRAGLPPFIQAKPFAPRCWVPPSYIVASPEIKQRTKLDGLGTVDDEDKDIEEGEIRAEPKMMRGSLVVASPQDMVGTSPDCLKEREEPSKNVSFSETFTQSSDRWDVTLDSQGSGTMANESDRSQELDSSRILGDQGSSQRNGSPRQGNETGTPGKRRQRRRKLDDDQNKLWLGDKAIADVAEAIIGAAYISGGRETALKVTKALEIPIPNVDRWSDFGRKVLAPPPDLIVKVPPGTIDAVEKIIGRPFKHPHLLAQALTHASIQGFECTSYERLEFIGDAILDFLVIRFIFNREIDLDPGGLTLLKGAMVSNSTLAAVCIWSGLHKHLMFESMHLSSTIEEYVTLINARQAEEYAAAVREGRSPGQYWLETEPPKVLSDVIESVIGAMYLSDNFSPVGAEVVFDVLLKPFYERHITSSTVSQHPTKVLFEMLQAHGCQRFEIVKESRESQGTMHCEVVVHDIVLSSAEDHVPQLASRRASAFGLDAIEGDKEFMTRVCNCRQRLHEERKKRKESNIAKQNQNNQAKGTDGNDRTRKKPTVKVE